MGRVVVGGAFATNSEVLLGNYQGVPQYVITLLDGLKMVSEPILISEEKIEEKDKKVLETAKVVVLGVGLSQKVEAECLDR